MQGTEETVSCSSTGVNVIPLVFLGNHVSLNLKVQCFSLVDGTNVATSLKVYVIEKKTRYIAFGVCVLNSCQTLLARVWVNSSFCTCLR